MRESLYLIRKCYRQSSHKLLRVTLTRHYTSTSISIPDGGYGCFIPPPFPPYSVSFLFLSFLPEENEGVLEEGIN